MKRTIGIIVLVLAAAAVVAGSPQSQEHTAMTTVRVRYMAKEIEPAIEFYTKSLGFQLKQQNKPYFAMVSNGNLELILSSPFGPGGAAKPMADGRNPRRAVGTASASTLMISRQNSPAYRRPMCISAMTL